MVQRIMIKGFMMKKNIFIIMVLFVIVGTVSAMDDERPTTPDDQGTSKECPPQTPRYKEAAKERRDIYGRHK